MRGIALLLFGILLAVASTVADEFVGYPADSILWCMGIVIGVVGLTWVFIKKD